MKLDALLEYIERTDLWGRRDLDIHGITADSRQVREGFLFVAVRGGSEDGWDYVEDAVRRGAVVVVSSREHRPALSVCQVRVADARGALADLAAAFHGHPSARLQMVGITGTNGKTTTAYMVRDILQRVGRQPGLISTVQYEIGSRMIPAQRTTPEPTLLQSLLSEMVDIGCASAVMEVSSHALLQERTRGVAFDTAVFTNLTRDHLDYHGTLESYFEAKALLFQGLGKGGKLAHAVVNIDGPWGRKLKDMLPDGVRLLTYGMQGEATVSARNIVLSPRGSTFSVQSPWGSAPASLRLLGRYNVSNALAAITACGTLGVPLDKMLAALAAMAYVPGRLEEVPIRKDYQVFVDYAHTDDALEHVLTTLREITRNRLIVVFGCGGSRDRTKRPAMGEVASRLADAAVLTTDNPRSEDPASIIAEIRAGFASQEKCEIREDRHEAIECAVRMAREGDVVLIAGKGHETFQEFSNRTIPFDDRQVVMEAANALGRDGG